MFKNTRAFSSFSVDDLDAARDFYEGKLGLEVSEESEGLILHLAGGVRVFLYLSTDYQPPDHTVLNFIVDDVEATLAALAKKGIEPEHYDLPGIETDEDGIFRGDGRGGPEAIAWFKDPAGHVLSVLTEPEVPQKPKKRPKTRQATPTKRAKDKEQVASAARRQGNKGRQAVAKTSKRSMLRHVQRKSRGANR